MKYRNFDLQISHESGEVPYVVKVIDSPAGKAAASFVRPFTNEALGQFVRQNASSLGTSSFADERLKDFGGKLFEAVFRDEVSACYKKSLQAVKAEGAGLRLLLQLTGAPELLELPWEFMYDKVGKRFLAFDNQTPLVHYLPDPDAFKAQGLYSLNSPLNVLVAMASPKDTPVFDYETEWQNLSTALSSLVDNKKIAVTNLLQPTVAELHTAFRAKEYHVFHFMGHGGFDEANGAGFIALIEDHKNEGTALFSAERLGLLMHNESQSLALVVLNTCESARTSLRDPFSGVAQTLVQQGVPSVIAMQYAISDQAAIRFSEVFYEALAEGYPVDAAVTEARVAIALALEGGEWGVPRLFTSNAMDQSNPFEQDAAESDEVIAVKSSVVPPVPISEQTPGASAAANKRDKAPPPRDSNTNVPQLAAEAVNADPQMVQPVTAASLLADDAASAGDKDLYLHPPSNKFVEIFRKRFDEVEQALLESDDNVAITKLRETGAWVSTRWNSLETEQAGPIAELARYAVNFKLWEVADQLFRAALDLSQNAPEFVVAYVDFVTSAKLHAYYDYARELLDLYQPDPGSSSQLSLQPRLNALAARLEDLRKRAPAVAWEPGDTSGSASMIPDPSSVLLPPSNPTRIAGNEPDAGVGPLPVRESTQGDSPSQQHSPLAAPTSVVVQQPPPGVAASPYFECEIDLSASQVDLRLNGPGLGGQPRVKFELDMARLNAATEIEQYGTVLFGSLISGEVRDAYHHALEVAKNHQPSAPLHLRLRIDPNATEYHSLLWEYLYDDDTNRAIGYLAGSPATPFSRFLVHGENPPVLAQTKTLRILFAFADPVDLGNRTATNKIYRLPRLDLVTEIDTVRSAANAMQSQLHGQNIALEYEILTPETGPVTLTAIHDRLQKGLLVGGRRGDFHVLHVVAHGVVDGGIHQIILEDENHKAKPHDARSFAREIDPAYGVRLVFLASCLSAQQSAADAYAGLAAQLVTNNIPAVVAMMQKVSFETVHEFTQHFYLQLAFHGVVDRAMNAARRAMYAGRDWNQIRSDKEWAIPVLFMRSKDGRLFDTGYAAQTLDQPVYQVEQRTFADSHKFDLERVIGDLVGEIGSRMAQGMNLSVPQRQGIEQRLLQIAQSPPPATQAEQSRPVLFRTDPVRRAALRVAVQEYRASSWRRHVLILRELGRRAALKKLRAAGEMIPGDWITLLTQGQVQIGANLWQVAGGGPTNRPPDERLVPLRDLRDLLRSTPEEITPIGNLTEIMAGQPPNWDDNLARAIEALLASEKEPPDKRIAQAGALPVELASLLLHLALPGEVAPYEGNWAAGVQVWLGAPNLPAQPDYREWLGFVKDLLADEELGFDDLPDVIFFLQQVAQPARQTDPARPAVAHLNTVRQPVVKAPLALESSAIDSVLSLPAQTFPSLAATLNAGKHVILSGPPGTGKTTLAQDIGRYAADLGFSNGFIAVTATADWTTFDTIGGYMPSNRGDLFFRPGVFLRAIRENKWLIIDEINRADIDKAFGELFTVLSGQGVTLPYERGGSPIRILPPGEQPQSDNDFAVHRSWRIIGTMNVYDKASLFAMSYAFMRRFAFVEVELPASDAYERLIKAFIMRIDALSEEEQAALTPKVIGFFDRSDLKQWPLMKYRALGPAFAKDIVGFLAWRLRNGDGEKNRVEQALAEAFNLYAIPQLDGLDREAITQVHASVPRVFGELMANIVIRPRIKELFPHIRDEEWQAVMPQITGATSGQ